MRIFADSAHGYEVPSSPVTWVLVYLTANYDVPKVGKLVGWGWDV